MVESAIRVVGGVYDEIRDVGKREGIGGWADADGKTQAEFEKWASERLGGGELKERLGEELMPARLSKCFLEAINALAKQVEDAEDAKELLSRARDGRLGVGGASNDEKK